MYAFINGIVDEITPEGIVIDAGGVGYFIQCTSSVSASVTVGEKSKIYTYQHVREDAIVLFGFASKEERTMFLRLISVSGIGPKSAIQVLSAISARDLALILVTGDYAALCKVPGIGKKTAQRLVLELREKVDNDEFISQGASVPSKQNGSAFASDAIYALTALGYSAAEATKAVEAVSANATSTEDIIKQVLKNLDRR